MDARELLLADKTTGRNIVWATQDKLTQPVTMNDIDSIVPRHLKPKQEQKSRTKTKAEVFTPTWVCNKMINMIDEDWFGYKPVFTTEYEDKTWSSNPDNIRFPEDKTWQDYVKSVRMEITCGEAPFLVSPYDTVTGEYIPTFDRIGMLDRKLRVVNENTQGYDEWFHWTVQAYKSIYGYEYQGDNLFLARMNLLDTFVENCFVFNDEAPRPGDTLLIANIIARNIWQMDGLTDLVPYTDIPAQIMDWEAGKVIEFRSLKGEK